MVTQLNKICSELELGPGRGNSLSSKPKYLNRDFFFLQRIFAESIATDHSGVPISDHYGVRVTLGDTHSNCRWWERRRYYCPGAVTGKWYRFCLSTRKIFSDRSRTICILVRSLPTDLSLEENDLNTCTYMHFHRSRRLECVWQLNTLAGLQGAVLIACAVLKYACMSLSLLEINLSFFLALDTQECLDCMAQWMMRMLSVNAWHSQLSALRGTMGWWYSLERSWWTSGPLATQIRYHSLSTSWYCNWLEEVTVFCCC